LLVKTASQLEPRMAIGYRYTSEVNAKPYKRENFVGKIKYNNDLMIIRISNTYLNRSLILKFNVFLHFSEFMPGYPFRVIHYSTQNWI
jgi:hypothetical protein